MAVTVDAASVATFVLVVLAWLHGNKRIDDTNTNLGKRIDLLDKRIDDTKEVIRAEMKAFRVEVLAEFRSLNEKIDNQMKQHIAEYHK